MTPRLPRVNATPASRRVGRVRTVVLVASAPVALGGCVATTNFDAQTDQIYSAADGANDRSGSVDVLNALVVSEEPGTGRVIAGLVNNEALQPDELTGVRGVGDSAELTVSVDEGETEIPASGLLQLADDGSAVVSVSGDPELVAPGGYVELAFSFAEGEEIEIDVPVLPPGTDYTEVELPTPSTSPAE